MPERIMVGQSREKLGAHHPVVRQGVATRFSGSPLGPFLPGGDKVGFLGTAATPPPALKALRQMAQEIKSLEEIRELVLWDSQTDMPQVAGDNRVGQLVALVKTLHAKQTSPELGQVLGQLQQPDTLSQLDEATQGWVRRAAKTHRILSGLPVDFVGEVAQKTGEAHLAWKKAREANDFGVFEPALQALVDISREKSRLVIAAVANEMALEAAQGIAQRTASTYLGWLPQQTTQTLLLKAITPIAKARARIEAQKIHPYVAAVGEYEPGMTLDALDRMYDGITTTLVPWIEAVKTSKRQFKDGFLKKEYPVPQQLALCEEVAKAMGFDLNRGQIGESVHPHYRAVGGPYDVRITMRREPFNPMEALLGVVHEAGHGIYDQGVSPKHLWPDAGPASMGIHESQALLWEFMVGRSRPFWAALLPTMRQHFFHQLDHHGLNEVHPAINRVKPTLLRTEADEVTYNLHLAVRYEIEKALFDGSLKAKAVPQVWADKMERYLGVRPKTDNEGALQDIHWSAGMFGYFPAYTLGTMMAAQWMLAAEKAIPGLATDAGWEKYADLKQWLNREIHQHGRTQSAEQLLRRVTGEPLNPAYYYRHLHQKLTALYPDVAEQLAPPPLQ